MTSYAVTAITPKTSLSREEFELICNEAAKNSTDCEAYISNVIEDVRLRLGDRGSSVAPPEMRWSSDNVQVLVITLYQLLEERCEFDFDVSVVLNSCASLYQNEDLLSWANKR